MNIFINIIIINILIIKSISGTNVCTYQRCKCTKSFTNVNCDTKGWTNLQDKEFPFNTVTLTLINNQLKFDTSKYKQLVNDEYMEILSPKIDDRLKIENLISLSDLSLNQNPLGIIPPFNNTYIRSLSLQDTSLTSAEFPSSYSSSFLKTVSLNSNKILSINENDFINLKNCKINRLYMDNVNLLTIHQNAFIPLIQLQSLSLRNNQLKSCEFLSTFRLLSSIKLDGNKFTSLPQELSSPKNIKTFYFTSNSISVIDESSPLNIWMKKNLTNIKIYLANNTFDCCQSLWFIRFLNTSSHFIGDASLLTCVTPSNYSGKQLIKLNPDEMNCGGIIPNKPWWTIGRIIGAIIGGVAIIVTLIFIIIIIVRRKRTHSGYTEIDGDNDPSPNAALLPSSDLPYPTYGVDDDAISTYSTAVTRNTAGSQAPLSSTADGVSAMDDIQV